MPRNVAVDHRTLQSFFYAELGEAQVRTGASLPPEVGAYVVDLLSRYARRPAEAGRTAEPLAIQYLTAKQSSGTARAQALRGVGDRALYIAGVVPQSLHRGAVRVTYVRSIGEAAYRDVAEEVGPLVVFTMLAELFEEVSEVLADIMEPAHNDTEDIVVLYERWRRYGDPRDAKRLIRAGVLLDAKASDTLQ